MLRKYTEEMALRLQPNSAIMGLNITPKESRTPAFKNRIRKDAATMYQP